jgi:SOS-response transcriptional repressor LexA
VTPPTRRQAEILAYIREFLARNGYAPTHDEIRRQFQLKALSTVNKHLMNLTAGGHLVRHPYRARGIAVSDGPAASYLCIEGGARYVLLQELPGSTVRFETGRSYHVHIREVGGIQEVWRVR